MGMTLAELASRCQAEYRGDPQWIIERVAPLDKAGPHDLGFVVGHEYRELLNTTAAGVVVLHPRDVDRFGGNLLLSENPRLTFTRAASILHPIPPAAAGRHVTAVIDATAQVAADAAIGPHVVVEAGARIGLGVAIGAGCSIGREVSIGAGTRLYPNVTVTDQCVIGARCIIHPGAVVGSDGFGYAVDGTRWEKTPQMGRVVIGDDVEIGANTTIDRGALGDTLIERGVKLDNLIQVAHNVVIGEDTAIAACVGIAGSTRIGRRCTIAGQAGIVGHIEIVDDVHILGAAVVSHSIHQPGRYAGSPVEPYARWLRNAVRMRQLDEMAHRLQVLEKKVKKLSKGGDTIE
jgi:UDP-3-O-[3-hydroxymyristoyl] glucosamine N-acyltransferase